MTTYATLREWFDEFEKEHGTIIEYRFERSDWSGPDDWPHDAPIGKQLERRFNTDYGGAEVPPVYAWSASHVFVIHEYDGSTQWSAVPRSPADFTTARYH